MCISLCIMSIPCTQGARAGGGGFRRCAEAAAAAPPQAALRGEALQGAAAPYYLLPTYDTSYCTTHYTAYCADCACHPCKVRVYVYTAHGLRTKSTGEKPQPFLKVFNGLGEQQTRTTRDRPLGSTLSPEFHASFELSAYLPGEAQLYVQVCDHTRAICICIYVQIGICANVYAHMPHWHMCKCMHIVCVCVCLQVMHGHGHGILEMNMNMNMNIRHET